MNSKNIPSGRERAMRKEYRLTSAQLRRLKKAAWEPDPIGDYMVGHKRDQQERVTAVWRALGFSMGFDPMTAQALPGKDERCFTAEEEMK